MIKKMERVEFIRIRVGDKTLGGITVKQLPTDECWRGWEKGTLVHCGWECKLVQPLWKIVWKFIKKIKTELPYDPGIPLLGIYPRKPKTLTWKDTCTPVLRAALFAIAKVWKQPKCPSTDEWIRRCNGILVIKLEWNTTQPLNRMKFCHLKQHRLGGYVKWNKSEKDKYCVISLIHGI